MARPPAGPAGGLAGARPGNPGQHLWHRPGRNRRGPRGDHHDDIRIDHPQIALRPDGTVDATKRWFNIDAGFERDPAKQPALFQKRVFPFRIDGVRGFNFTQLNLNFGRNFGLGGTRILQVRVDLQNALNRQQWGNPNLDPTSTNFGLVTAINATVMRFITFVTRVSF